MKSYFGIFLIFLLASCYPSPERDKKKTKIFFKDLDTINIVPGKGVVIEDSIIRKMFVDGKFQEIADGKWLLDNELKKGVYSASLSILSRYDEAKKYLNRINEIETEEIDGEIRIPSYKDSVDFYSAFSLYKYITLSGNLTGREQYDLITYGFHMVRKKSRSLIEEYILIAEKIHFFVLNPNVPNGEIPLLSTFEPLKKELPNYPIVDYIMAEYQYSQSLDLLKYDSTIHQFVKDDLQAEYSLRMLMDKYINPELKDSTRAYEVYEQYNSRYTNCNPFGLDFQCYILKKYDSSFYRACLPCLEGQTDYQLIYGNIYLGHFYLMNNQFNKVDSLVTLYKQSVDPEIIYYSPIRIWELGEYYMLELSSAFFKRDFRAFKNIAYNLKKNDRFKTNHSNNKVMYENLVKRFYRWYIDNDLNGYEDFVTKYNVFQ